MRMTRNSQRLLTALVAATVLLGANPATATAPGVNGRIAYRVYFNDAHSQGAIFTLEPDGTGLQQLTRPGRMVLTNEPDWSPDGRWIVYMAERHGNEDRSRIFKILADGSGRTDLGGSCIAPCLTDGFPTWSPDGTSIAFQRGLGPAIGHNKVIAIFVMSADGTGALQVTQQGASPAEDARFEDLAPAWSPDGTTLAFERLDRTTDHHAIFTVAADGTGLERITPWLLDAAQPDYSPDGQWILFRSKETSGTSGNLWVVRPDGTARHAITHDASGTGKWLSASFSPDGTQVTAARTRVVNGSQENADVWVMNADGSGLRNITGTPNMWESAPDWGSQPSAP
jgi:Tol biopolymer transport system component